MAKLFAIEEVALSSCKFVVPVSDLGLHKSTKMKPFTALRIIDVLCSGPNVAVFTEI